MTRSTEDKPPAQLRREDLKTLTPREIVDTERACRLDHLLGLRVGGSGDNAA